MPSVVVDESARARQLRRMRLVAGGLLVGMFGLFFAARHWQAAFPWLSYARAFAEAAMVGGFADWFAVTALFRHPFGLPIPHTAIIPRNKDRIGQSLGGFVANNFLSPDVLMPKVKAQDLARRLGSWLQVPANARFVARRITAAGPPLVAAMRDEPVRRMLREAAVGRLHHLAAAPLLSKILTILVAGGQHLALFDLGLEVARGFLLNNQDGIHQRICDKSRWWVPDFVDQRLARRFIVGGLETLDEMQSEDHPWRLQFQDSVARLIDRMANAPESLARAEALKEEIISHPEVQAYLESLWQEAKRVILADLAGGDRIETVLTDALSGFAFRLGQDAALREVVNSWINRAVLHVVVPNRTRLGAFMAGVVRNWDTPTLVAKLELQVGRDLQYIRINGTLVGGAIGLLIHALT
ncbi:MAG TPA: DUF445 domain-containing protein [Rhodospirillaceae bacterium]|nr:DUF445 domain-containing protein [Rhodospirillaceae bacterium]